MDNNNEIRTLSREMNHRDNDFLEVKIHPQKTYKSIHYIDNIRTHYNYMYGVTTNSKQKFVSDILKSNLNSSEFNAVLKNVVFDDESQQADFYHVNSVEGVFLANIYDDNVYHKTMGNEKMENYKQTKISFNMGGTWELIEPPKLDSLKQPITCPGNINNCK